MSNISANNKRIAKNTLYLYGRMFISLALSLITGRVVLQTLGVEDYGINAVVGSVIGMFAVIQTSMIGATSRFITFEMGKGDDTRLKETFSTTLTVHIIIAIILFVVLETIGLWFLNNKLVIPENRMFAANCIYQLSIISTMLGITQTPYSSTLVAHEKMDVYAYFDILNTLLKLVIIYVLLIGNMDKLILYGILTFCVSTFMLFLNRVYCIKHFPETRYTFVWRKDLLKPIISFSGWDVFGNVAVMARSQGVTMLLNMFFGPVMNAAAGIANSVTAITGGFTSNIIMAVRPQLIKRYANGEYDSMMQLAHQGITLSFVLMTYITVPLMSEIHFVLKLWLGIVPDYACIFTNLILIFNIVGCISSVVITIIQATGYIKKSNIINGILYIFVIPITYIAYQNGAPVWIPFAYNALVFFVGSMFNVYFIKSYIPTLKISFFFIKTVLPCLILFCFVSATSYVLHTYMDEGWLRLIYSISLTIILTTTISFMFLLDKYTRKKILFIIKERFHIT